MSIQNKLKLLAVISLFLAFTTCLISAWGYQQMQNHQHQHSAIEHLQVDAINLNITGIDLLHSNDAQLQVSQWRAMYQNMGEKLASYSLQNQINLTYVIEDYKKAGHTIKFYIKTHNKCTDNSGTCADLLNRLRTQVRFALGELLTELSKTEVQRSAQTQQLNLILSILLIAIPIATLLFIVAIVLPIKQNIALGLAQMIEASKHFGHGDFSFRAESNNQDEMGVLAQAFNRMAEQRESADIALHETEDNFKAITAQTTEGISVADPDGNYTFVNPAFCKMMGYSNDELLQMTVFDMKAPGQDHSSFSRSKTSAEGAPIQVLLQRKDGTQFISEVTGKKIVLSGQDQVLGIVRDITERKQAEDALAEQKNYFETIIETEPECVKIVSPSGELQHMNQAGLKMLEASDDNEVNAHGLINFILPEYRKEFSQFMKNILAGNNGMLVYLIESLKGTRRWMESHASPLRNAQGDVIAMLAVTRDITERKQTEQALRHAQKMDAIGQMSSGIAHDFNNQLGIVRGFLELLADFINDKKFELQGRWINNAEQATERCITLTRQLLIFSRGSETGTMQVKLNPLLRNMEELIQRTITPEITVLLKLPEGLWPICTNQGDLKDVLLNMIINARDAMDHGGILTLSTNNIDIKQQDIQAYNWVKPGEFVQVHIKDTGAGISDETMNHLFDPFYTTKEVGKGTGLGLAMAYGFIKRNGGFIKVNSEVNQGSEFTLHIPRGYMATVEKNSNENITTNITGKKESILIVDDEEDLLALAKEMLESLNYKVLTAENGHAALQILNENTAINLLFSDVIMPGGINGYELAEQAITLRPDLQILLTSGHASKQPETKTQIKLAENLLKKPYTKSQLAENLHLLLS
jgi:PAS domain S-box-containing protein